ncbi:hypothetical protein L602_000600000590 [Cupriavidus gilardii J11]|uniref:Esterase n=1 Tax=Cupriavidus gilardii J11 TaxID=936133 RepID=A0A562B3N3_9BURK|nr:alpha/beta hydrolase [Cupriavidus gilardii]TWG79659.1 hypothetical protein L602_000600000590 [Cupriavidus gilardii J11]
MAQVTPHAASRTGLAQPSTVFPELAVPAGLAILTVPGLYGSGPDHWQSRWEARFPDWERVVQHDWARPSLHLWAGQVGATVARRRATAPRGVVLVAHSFGCLAVVYQAALDSTGIAGALLVAPADPDRFGVGPLLPAFRLPFPTVLAASRNDPWIAQRTAFSWGALWGADVHDVGSLGHINAESGLGTWPEGIALLGSLLQRIDASGLSAGPADGATPWEAGVEVHGAVPYI